jgi:hypothetical protein
MQMVYKSYRVRGERTNVARVTNNNVLTLLEGQETGRV